MIAFNRIGKQYGRQVLFVDASFQLNPGEKVGLVGPNGSGKTTLFRMIVGEEAPDDGTVSVPKKLTVGYFRQDVEEMSGRSVIDEAIAGTRLGALHHELDDLQHALADPARAVELDRLLARFGEVQEEYEHLGGYALESQAREVLHGLGFDDEQIDGDVGALSGGWKMRVAMARALLGKPDVLLMDEPTNHLDIESILWLEAFITSLPGALLMTSHDRDFMNRIVSRVAEIDDGEITTYSGNYDFYERERALREANREAAHARQQAMLAKEQRFIDRFASHAAKAAQVQSRVKALDKIEKIKLPKQRRVVKFNFQPPPRSGDDVAILEGIDKRYGSRVIYDGLNLNVRRGERWAVMGRNGAGKTTLLRLIAGALEPDAGSVRIGASVKMGYFAQQALQILDPKLTVEEQMIKPGFPICLPQMAPLYTREPPSARNSVRRTIVQLQRPSPQPTLTWNRPEPLLSGHFSDTAPHLCPFFASLRCTRPRVSLPAPAAPRSSAASRRRAAGSDDLPPAGASSIWRASPAGLRFSPAAAGDSSATSA